VVALSQGRRDINVLSQVLLVCEDKFQCGWFMSLPEQSSYMHVFYEKRILCYFEDL